MFFLCQTVDGALADGGASLPSSSNNMPMGGGRRLRNYLARVEREGVRRVRMFLVITAAYILFWGPLFIVTLFHHPVFTSHIAYEVSFDNQFCFVAKVVAVLRDVFVALWPLCLAILLII